MEYLESEGFDVKLARDGDTGLRYALESSFDLYLLDVMLPKRDGFDLARAIRSR